MAGNTLTVSAKLQCPHGGTVQIVPSNPLVKTAGDAVATTNDAFTVIGCSFLSPCATVQWVAADIKVKTGGARTLSKSSQGICYGAPGPQGPVVIVNTQTKVSTQ